VPRRFLQGLGFRDLQHGAHDVDNLAPEEPRLGTGELDEELERLLRDSLLAGVQCLGERLHHEREEVLEAVAVRGTGEALDEVDGGGEGGDADVGGGGGVEAAEEDGVESGQLRE